MRTNFIKPRFTGARFNEHSLPLDVARDLAAYQNLIIEVAKRLYLKDNPERQYTPKGFGSAFELHLDHVESGSAIVPLIALTAAISTEPNAQQYFNQARELVTDCIAAPADKIPTDFPLDLLNYFNRVGSSLREGEQMELPRGGGGTATLTPSRRKALVLAQSKVYSKQVELVGFIEAMDWGKNSFKLRVADGSEAHVQFDDHFEATARLHAGNPRHQVTVRCVASYDASERLKSVDQVESISLQANYEIANRLESITSLKDGWYDGGGRAPSQAAMAIVSKMLVHLYPKGIQLPLIVPMQDGNILLEWNALGEPSLDIDLSAMTAWFQQFALDGSDVEADFKLQTEEDWRRLMGYLSNHIE
ncbi:MAG: hypothetical protein IPN38_11770 [Flavobacteriales bacterium]|nr:hypothetical protein [Flavobacteriales bacterium]